MVSPSNRISPTSNPTKLERQGARNKIVSLPLQMTLTLCTAQAILLAVASLAPHCPSLPLPESAHVTEEPSQPGMKETNIISSVSSSPHLLGLLGSIRHDNTIRTRHPASTVKVP